MQIASNLHLLGESEWSSMHEQFLTSWRAARDRLVRSLGTPRFQGGVADPGMPEGEDAVRLASWLQSGREVSVQYRHVDVPIFV